MTDTLRNPNTLPDEDDNYIDYVDEHDEQTGADDASGTSPGSLSLPDQSPRAELIAAIATGVAKAIEQERRNYSAKRQGFIDNQSGGTVSYATFAVGQQPVQICREKSNRKSALVTMSALEGQIYIGSHVGITIRGTDTITIYRTSGDGPDSVDIPSTAAIWAISNDPAGVEITVMETFV